MAKAQFSGRVIPKNRVITLTVPISMSNRSQTQAGFEALIDLVIATESITTLDVIIGAGLYAHYWGEQIAAEQEIQWRADNLAALQKLKISGKSYKLISWNEVKKLPNFKLKEEQVNTLYHNDRNFYDIVNDLSVEQAEKQNTSKEKTINFLLEECSVFLILNGYVAYPSRNINDAISEAARQLGKNFEYVPYNISYTKTRALIPQMLSPDHPLITVFKQAIVELEKNGISDNNGRIVFFKGILRQIAQESEKGVTEKNEETVF